jgi:hypothetical protein
MAAKSIDYNRSDSISGSILRCCKSENKSAYGYNWQLVEISEEDWLKLFK